jgi:hypothetical protein
VFGLGVINYNRSQACVVRPIAPKSGSDFKSLKIAVMAAVSNEAWAGLIFTADSWSSSKGLVLLRLNKDCIGKAPGRATPLARDFAASPQIRLVAKRELATWTFATLEYRLTDTNLKEGPYHLRLKPRKELLKACLRCERLQA